MRDHVSEGGMDLLRWGGLCAVLFQRLHRQAGEDPDRESVSCVRCHDFGVHTVSLLWCPCRVITLVSIPCHDFGVHTMS